MAIAKSYNRNFVILIAIITAFLQLFFSSDTDVILLIKSETEG